jgi:hypothetical protein
METCQSLYCIAYVLRHSCAAKLHCMQFIAHRCEQSLASWAAKKDRSAEIRIVFVRRRMVAVCHLGCACSVLSAGLTVEYPAARLTSGTTTSTTLSSRTTVFEVVTLCEVVVFTRQLLRFCGLAGPAQKYDQNALHLGCSLR